MPPLIAYMTVDFSPHQLAEANREEEVCFLFSLRMQSIMQGKAWSQPCAAEAPNFLPISVEQEEWTGSEAGL